MTHTCANVPALKCWPIGASATAGTVADSDNDGIADYYELHDRPFVTNPQRVDKVP